MNFLKKTAKYLGIGLVGIAVALLVVYLFLPKGPRETLKFNDPYHQSRNEAIGAHYMAATGTPWATQAAMNTMRSGGNAFDAAITALLMINVTYGEAASFPSVAPTILYNAQQDSIYGYCGAGTAPQRATIKYFRDHGYKTIPNLGILAQLIPASPDALVSILSRFGTRSFSEVSAPAIKIAREGFPVHQSMYKNLDLNILERFGYWVMMPYNVDVYLGGQWWRPLHHNERFTRPDLANTLEDMANAEQAVLKNGGSREEGLQAVRNYFYTGPIADKIIQMHQKEDGLFTASDLANYKGYWEQPVSGHFRDYTIYANRTWCQGAVVPMVLQILDGIDLKAMGHNSPAYIHTVIQAIDLAMADREAYFGDPAFVKVPINGLLNPKYAAERRKLMTPEHNFTGTPPPGNPYPYSSLKPQKQSMIRPIETRTDKTPHFGKDTSYLTVIDSMGNVVSLTPSDFPQSPMVPGTGLTLGIRMTQFYLDSTSADALAPGKRPRITPNPGMVFKDGKFYMSFGTPGGDMQTQAMVQVFLNIVVFGMNPQQAVQALRFRSLNWHDSFAPHDYQPGTIAMERSLYEKTGAALKSLGYKIEVKEDWDNDFGAPCVILRNPASGKLLGGADPREESWAMGE